MQRYPNVLHRLPSWTQHYGAEWAQAQWCHIPEQNGRRGPPCAQRSAGTGQAGFEGYLHVTASGPAATRALQDLTHPSLPPVPAVPALSALLGGAPP